MNDAYKEWNAAQIIKNCWKKYSKNGDELFKEALEKLKKINKENKRIHLEEERRIKRKKTRKDSYEKKINKPDHYKRRMKNGWRAKGLNMNSFEEVFDRYLKCTNCEVCGVHLIRSRKSKSNTKCLGIDKVSGECINVWCVGCKVESQKLFK